ncbi:L-seryl-tRNA(Sec) kinase [Lissotriton helveticus]
MHTLSTTPRPLLCLLSGLPASGKSSLALALCNVIRHRATWACALICYDEIITPDAFQRETSPAAQLEEGGSVSEEEAGWSKQEETSSLKGEDSEQHKWVEHKLSKEVGRLELRGPKPARSCSEETVKLKGDATYLNREEKVYLKGQEIRFLQNTGTGVQNTGTGVQEDGGYRKSERTSATVFGDTADVERQMDLHPEVLDCANNPLPPQTTDDWISNWKLYRQELLLYVDCFLTSVATGAPLSAPKDHTEALWSRFICCLDSQGLFSYMSAEAGSVCGLKLTESSFPLCIVLDDNFYYQSMRYQVYQLARKHSAGFCQLFLDCTVELCLQRNHQRNISLPDEIIHVMSRKLERPNPEKNPWEQKSLILDMSECTWDSCRPRVMDLMQIALESPVKYLPEDTEQKDVDRAIAASSLLHQADQAFRRIVSQTMEKAQGKVPPKEKKVLAKELHRLKGDILQELRQKAVIGPCSSLHLDDPLSKIIFVFQGRADSTVQQYTKLAVDLPKH